MIDSLLSSPLIALFAALAAGLALGNIRFWGLSLGSSGVLFTGLALGHFGYALPPGVGSFGLVLFVYCVGVGAGVRFFSALARQGSQLAWLSLLVVGSAALLTILGAHLLHLPADLAVGIFAGALTSTPALAAATDFLKEAGAAVPVGYGLAYPFGILGVVLFVQLLPRLLRLDLAKLASEHRSGEPGDEPIVTAYAEVTNPNLDGKRIAETPFFAHLPCQVTRVLREGRMAPLHFDDCFASGLVVMIVGRREAVQHAVDFLGRAAPMDKGKWLYDADRERRQIVISAPDLTNRALRDLGLIKNYHVVVSRITRLGFTFAPTADTVVERNDVLTVVGHEADLERFATAAGHRSQAFEETDLLSLGIGVTLGIILGLLTIKLPGGGELSLGLAGGPLLAGLLLGHFGRVGRIVGHIPRPTRLLLQEMGLVLFLADAGQRGGIGMLATISNHGPVILLMGALVTLLPMALAFVLARRFFRMHMLETLGGICGSMTSTPALGALTAKTDSPAPVVAYATAYPVALILMTFAAKFVIQAIGGLP